MGNMVKKVSAGDCFLIRGWKPVNAIHDPERPLTVFWNYFNFVNIPLPIPDTALPAFYRRIKDRDLFTKLYENVIVNFTNSDPENKEANIWMRSLLLALQTEDSKPRLAGIEKEQFERIEKICSMITDNPSKQYSISDLAGMVNYSPSHFYRLFKKHKSISPKEFMINTKITAAKSLLLNSSMSIKQISFSLGFPDIFYFSNIFKKQTGISPSKYRIE